MAKFIYKLQNVLSIKEKMEEQKKMELGNANIKLLKLEDEMSVIEKHRDDYINEFYSKRKKVMKASELANINKSIKYFADKTDEYKELIQKATIEVEKKREELKEALLEKKKYEVLKERAYERFVEEEKEEENKTVDEIINYKYRNQ